ncbi:MAG: succinyl-diaminopimelate desuccinylase [Methyloligella sp.]|nr:MAG: succinyl-diaminopimelate desuccinylase [Methyloligella sp.]
MSDTAIKYAQDLIACESVTPIEGGALTYLESLLSNAGFSCTRLPFSEEGTADVDNLYAQFGSGQPHLMFAGHTDVVDPGDLSLWTYPPFSGEIHDGKLYGRGSADMKGGIACFLAAALEHIKHPDFKGTISFLITGDEEGPAINGTVKMLKWLKEQNIQPTHAIVGEPTNPSFVGEAIKIGRRGSLNGWLTVKGKQGHVAYPHLASNPIDGIALALVELKKEELDGGTPHFLPSHLEITSVDVGNKTVNVIPSEARCHFNIRYNDTFTAAELEALIQRQVTTALIGKDLDFSLKFQRSADCFVTEPGPWIETLTRSIFEVTNMQPSLSTSGGTSDARFIKNVCPVVELGLSNATIHQIDENVSLKDMAQLTEIYEKFLNYYFA